MALKFLLTLCQLGLVFANNNTTTVMTSTTMEETTTTTMMTTTGERVVISGCTQLGGDITVLAGNSEAAMAFASALAKLLNGVSAEHIQNIVFESGLTCAARRLDGERRLQTGGTVRYDIVLTGAEISAADSIVSAFASVTLDALQTELQTALTAAGITATITVTSVGSLMITESGGTTATTTTTTTGGSETPSVAYQNSFAFGVLMAIAAYMM